MKIVIRNFFGEYFCKYPEVCFVKSIIDAYYFTCINEEHAKIILEKTKSFIFNNDLTYEEVKEEDINENTKEKKAQKS